MPITALEVYPLREPRSGRTYTFMQIKDGSGITGWGECPELGKNSLLRARQALLGQEFTRYDVLTHQLADDPVSGGVNMALLDLCGQAMKAPVYQILGGPTRNKVRALTDDHEKALDQGHRAFVIPIRMPQQITSRPALLPLWWSSFKRCASGMGRVSTLSRTGSGYCRRLRHATSPQP